MDGSRGSAKLWKVSGELLALERTIADLQVNVDVAPFVLDFPPAPNG